MAGLDGHCARIIADNPKPVAPYINHAAAAEILNKAEPDQLLAGVSRLETVESPAVKRRAACPELSRRGPARLGPPAEERTTEPGRLRSA